MLATAFVSQQLRSSGRAPRKFIAHRVGAALRSLLFASVSALSIGCGAAGDGPGVAGAEVAGSGTVASGGSGGTPLDRPRCQAPAGTSGSPRSIEEAVALLNALPKPTSAACFVESLDRPLSIFATNSQFSAQPALSSRSPRVFLERDQLWLSIVIDGDSSYLIEFAYELPDLTSIKGELKLPLTAPVGASAPYDRVLYDEGTICGMCHTAEHAVDTVPGARAFASTSFRPRPGSRVTLEDLRAEYQACDPEQEPHRCEMLAAVFDQGQVTESQFPSEMKTFF